MSLKYEPSHVLTTGEWWWRGRTEQGNLKLCYRSFFTLVTGPTRSFSLKLGDTRVYEPQIRARLGTAGRSRSS